MSFVHLNRFFLPTRPTAVATLHILWVAGAAASALPKSSPPGAFPAPAPFEAVYRLGWSGLVAARAEVHVDRPGSEIRLRGVGHTIGLTRALWRLNASFESRVDATRLRSLEARLREVYAGRSTEITHRFADDRIFFESIGQKSQQPVSIKKKTLIHPDALDLFGALLRLRSQKLATGDEARVVEVQGDTLYLVSVTVQGRETLRAVGRSWQAIRADLGLKKIRKDGSVVPHRKFRSATVWISDDEARHILRIESRVFVGAIYAELESLTDL